MKHSITLLIAVAFLSLGVAQAFANQPVAGVAGYVYDSNAKPVGKAFIEFTIKTEYRGIVSFSTRSDETGKYRIERLPAGRGWAKVNAGGRGRAISDVALAPNTINVVNFKLQ